MIVDTFFCQDVRKCVCRERLKGLGPDNVVLGHTCRHGRVCMSQNSMVCFRFRRRLRKVLGVATRAAACGGLFRPYPKENSAAPSDVGDSKFPIQPKLNPILNTFENAFFQRALERLHIVALRHTCRHAPPHCPQKSTACFQGLVSFALASWLPDISAPGIHDPKLSEQ